MVFLYNKDTNKNKNRLSVFKWGKVLKMIDIRFYSEKGGTKKAKD